MGAVKEKVEKVIKNLPDDCTFEDIQYHLYVVEKINRSLKNSKIKDSISHDEAKQRMKKWLYKVA